MYTSINQHKQTYVYACVYIYICVCIYIYIYVYIHTYIHTSTTGCRHGGAWPRAAGAGPRRGPTYIYIYI